MSLFSIGLMGYEAAQAKLACAFIDTANASTPGYSRQGVLLSSIAAGGVKVGGIMRLNDACATLSLIHANASLEQHKATQYFLDRLENVMKPTDNNRDLGIGDLFAKLSAAAGDKVTDKPSRLAVLTAADSMANQFNSQRSELDNELNEVETKRCTSVDQSNTLARDLAALNKQIAADQASGGAASTLLDKRDQLCDQLSGCAGVNVLEQADGTVNVSLGGGQPLVAGDRAAILSLSRDANGHQTIELRFAKQAFELPSKDLGGTLRGLDVYENETLRPQQAALSALANETATRFNAQLVAGFDTTGAPGKPLFSFDASTGKLGIDPKLKPEELAFSSDPKNPGDGGNLNKLIGLRNNTFDLPGLGSVKLDGAFPAMVTRIGLTSQSNKSAQANAQAMRDRAQDVWNSVSKVDMDEEGVDIASYQKIAAANMKLLTVASQLFQSVLDAL